MKRRIRNLPLKPEILAYNRLLILLLIYISVIHWTLYESMVNYTFMDSPLSSSSSKPGILTKMIHWLWLSFTQHSVKSVHKVFSHLPIITHKKDLHASSQLAFECFQTQETVSLEPSFGMTKGGLLCWK